MVVSHEMLLKKKREKKREDKGGKKLFGYIYLEILNPSLRPTIPLA